jgi:hypothetical protein
MNSMIFKRMTDMRIVEMVFNKIINFRFRHVFIEEWEKNEADALDLESIRRIEREELEARI